MGMAAGQARFLGLTARKTNIEFEGQQINQQRTTLANQSASYNNELLGLEVPTAPSTDKFTKTTYSWTANGGTTKNTIQNMVPTTGDSFLINYTYNQTSNAGYKTSDTERIQRTGTAPSFTYTGLTVVPAGSALTALQASEGGAYAGKSFHSSTDASTGVVKYYSDDELASGATVGFVDAAIFKIGSHSENVVKTDVPATIECDANGRMTNITMNSTKYALTANTETDEAGYNDAMSNYDYKKNKYTKTLDNVNAKISIIQSQDRSLELKLKQCDTEQQAISTEMDSVKKVVDKNIESSFKTFSA